MENSNNNITFNISSFGSKLFIITRKVQNENIADATKYK